jgi:hypothetical protein
VAGLPGSLLVLLLTGFLIVIAVHQDVIPGVRQDWLVRPIRRTDMLIAKLLFVLLVIHGPMFATDVLQGIMNGFSTSQSVEAALWRGVYVLCVFCVRALAIAAVTRSLTEVVVGLGAWLVAVAGLYMVPRLVGWTSPTDLTGVAWVSQITREGLLLAGALVVLSVQSTTSVKGRVWAH